MPGLLQPMGSQRVRRDIVIGQQHGVDLGPWDVKLAEFIELCIVRPLSEMIKEHYTPRKTENTEKEHFSTRIDIAHFLLENEYL